MLDKIKRIISGLGHSLLNMTVEPIRYVFTAIGSDWLTRKDRNWIGVTGVDAAYILGHLIWYAVGLWAVWVILT